MSRFRFWPRQGPTPKKRPRDAFKLCLRQPQNLMLQAWRSPLAHPIRVVRTCIFFCRVSQKRREDAAKGRGGYDHGDEQGRRQGSGGGARGEGKGAGEGGVGKRGGKKGKGARRREKEEAAERDVRQQVRVGMLKRSSFQRDGHR